MKFLVQLLQQFQAKEPLRKAEDRIKQLLFGQNCANTHLKELCLVYLVEKKLENFQM